MKIPLTCDLTWFSVCHRQRAYSKDTSIPEGDTKFGPGKSSHNFCICYLYWRDPSIQGTVAKYSKSPWRQLSQHELSHLHFRKSIYVLHLWEFYTQYRRFFIHYLAAWNNDCSRFPGRIKEKKNRLIINKLMSMRILLLVWDRNEIFFFFMAITVSSNAFSCPFDENNLTER